MRSRRAFYSLAQFEEGRIINTRILNLTQNPNQHYQTGSMKLLLALLVVASSLSRAFAQQYACGDVDGAPVEVPGMSSTGSNND